MPTEFPPDDIKHQLIAALRDDAAVAAIVAQRVFPNQIPDNVEHVPCVVVNLIDGRSQEVLSGYIGVRTSTLQVDSYGDISIQVVALAKACKLRIINHGGAFGDAIVRRAKVNGELDYPCDAPVDKSDRWRYRRVLRCEIDHCEDVE